MAIADRSIEKKNEGAANVPHPVFPSKEFRNQMRPLDLRKLNDGMTAPLMSSK